MLQNIKIVNVLGAVGKKDGVIFVKCGVEVVVKNMVLVCVLKYICLLTFNTLYLHYNYGKG